MIFFSPVASRVYVYPNIAAYSIIQKIRKYKSLVNFLDNFPEINDPNNSDGVNYDLSALIAHMEISKQLIFSEYMMTEFRDSLYEKWKNQNRVEFKKSKDYALKVVDAISEWINKDNYNQTRTMPKFMVDPSNIERWQPTPPSYMDGIEPHWNKIRPFALDSSSQFKPNPPPKFSMDKNSNFYKELKEVYEITNKITLLGDESEEIAIAQFWDCNPYVSVTRGHMMFATKN